MKVFFDIITNHTADVITYEQKAGEPAPYAYVPKDESPYRTAAGDPFDDRDYAGTQTFPPLSAEKSFPFIPHNPAGSGDAGDVNHKVPEWLNDVTAYHNRGDTTFAGENSQYGDFFGLDDLFTEQPRVVDGMTDIYKTWVRDFDIDGFRIDTMKHVNDEFWQQFAPAVVDYAHTQSRHDFFMFGEVFDTTKTFTSHFTTHDRVQAVLDFPFQEAARDFASKSLATNRLRDFFVGDDWYTDADSNAYQLPTFLGNHDMGRIGLFIRQANPDADDDEVLARDLLAHELMYFSRGNPVIYYGDEQGFVGDGGDQLARQDMFPSQVAEYNNDDNIGTEETPADDNFDPDHPLYEAIRDLADITAEHPALRNGVQQHRYASSGAGIYAFSRLDGDTQHEYVVALNNAEGVREAAIPTAAGPGAQFEPLYAVGDPGVGTTDSAGRLPVSVEGLSTVVYRSVEPIPESAEAPRISLAAAPEDEAPRGRVEVRAFLDGDSFYDVTFYAQVGDGAWTPIGTDDNRPHRVFHDVADLEPGTPVRYRAVVVDNAGHTRESGEYAITVAEPSITLTSPSGTVRGTVPLSAEATPDQNDYSVEFFRRIDGGAWESVGTDSSQPTPYHATDTLPDLEEGTPVAYRAVLTYAPGRTVTSETFSTMVGPEVTEAIVHYHRTADDYGTVEDGWGLHLWGNAKSFPDTDWNDPFERDGVDEDGARFVIPLADATQPLNFIVHLPGRDDVPTGREPGGDRSFIPADHPEIWLEQGDPAIHFTDPTP